MLAAPYSLDERGDPASARLSSWDPGADVMPVCSPYHSVEPTAGAVYHNNSSCPVGRTISMSYLREGMGVDRSLCEECVKVDLESWTDRALSEEHDLDLD
jgi:hypothetical protein